MLLLLAFGVAEANGQGHRRRYNNTPIGDQIKKPRADSLATVFKQPNYQPYFKAEELLIDEQKDAIPALISMLTDTSYQKLVNTFDLIYPGATQFYGHGRIVSYELDWVAVRAGWLLEEITFENFGYSGSPISEKELMDLHIKNYSLTISFVERTVA